MSPLYGYVVAPKAAAHRHHGCYFYGAHSHNFRKFVGCFLSSGSTFAYVPAGCDNSSIPVTSGKTAAAAVRAGQGLANHPDQRIFFYMKEFFKNTQRKSQKQGDSGGYCRRKNNYRNHFTKPPKPINARERRDAVTKRIGVPLRKTGTGEVLIRRLIPAIKSRERRKPRATPTA
jgi:hypothetical protein